MKAATRGMYADLRAEPLAARALRQGSFVGLLLFVYVVVTPNLNPLSGFSPYDSKRILQIVLLLINGIWLLFALKKADGPLTTYRSIPLSGRRLLTSILLLGCLSAAVAPLPHYGLLEVFHLVLLAALALTVAHLVRADDRMSRGLIVQVVTLSAVLYVVSFGVGYGMSLLSGDVRVWPRGYTGFDHIRFFNQYQTWTLPILVLPALLISERRTWKHRLLMVPPAAWWMLLFASGGRGTLAGLIVAVAVVVVAFGRQASSWLNRQGVAAAAGALAYGLLFRVLATTDASLLERDATSDSGRLWYWRRAVDMIQEHWLVGIGPMHSAGFPEDVLSHPHNVLLQLGSEWGIPATLVIVAAIFWGFLSWIIQSRRVVSERHGEPDHYVRIALTAAVAAAGTHALFSGITIMPLSQTLMSLIAGWMLGLFARDSLHRSTDNPQDSVPRRSAALSAVIVVAVAVVSWTAVPEALDRDKSREAYIEATNSFVLHPRYWAQGNIRF